jgi:hypothetical protein
LRTRGRSTSIGAGRLDGLSDRERDVAVEVDAIDRLDEPQAGNLEELVEGSPVRW